MILHRGARKRDGATVAIGDPETLLEWLGADRASVRFRGLPEIRAMQSAFEQIIRQWIRQV